MNGDTFERNFVLKGDICHSATRTSFETLKDGYLVCEDGRCAGIYKELPDRYDRYAKYFFDDALILPGLTDLHVHAPQFSFRGLGMDLELLDWLNTHTFPEEAKYADTNYAARAYKAFVDDVVRGPNTRAVVFATRHVPATELLMDMLESSGLITMVGKVNMDRNAHPDLQEESAKRSALDTRDWLARAAAPDRYRNTTPILTPRFIPSCSDDLMQRLSKIQKEYGLPVQSHLSENMDEVDWVRELASGTTCYADAYDRFGLFGKSADGACVPTVMAHCVHSDASPEEMRLLKENGVFVAHCPQSNTNLSSGIAPIRKFLNAGIRVGLGSDVAGGSDTSIFRIMADAVRASKLYWRLVDKSCKPLTIEEAFYLGTVGGGAFFGDVGTFRPGSEFDAIVVDDTPLAGPRKISIPDRVARAIYYADDRHIVTKYVRGKERGGRGR